MTTPPPQVPESPVAFPQRCSSCHSELDTPLACSGCHTIFAVSEELSHFDRLGIPEQFAVDLEDTEHRFLALSRELHPDFFTTRSAADQTLSLEHSAQLNDAIGVIRDPFRRAAYLLQRWCPQEDAERDQQMPDGFLEEMLSLREDVEDTLAEAPSPQRDATLGTVRTDLTARLDGSIRSLGEAFIRMERARADGQDVQPLATDIRRMLNAARYITGIVNRLRDAAV